MFPFQVTCCFIFPGDRITEKPLSFPLEMLKIIMNRAFVSTSSPPPPQEYCHLGHISFRLKLSARVVSCLHRLAQHLSLI